MEPNQALTDDELQALARAALALPDAPAQWVRRAEALGAPVADPVWLGKAAVAAMAHPAGQVVGQVARQLGRQAAQAMAAAVSFDSWQRPALACGMRSMPARTRHLLFTAQGRDIDLRIFPLADRYGMAGQVLGPDDAGTVELVHRPKPGLDDRQSHVAALDDLGEFRFAGLSQGTVSITLRLGADEVRLPPIEVGDRQA